MADLTSLRGGTATTNVASGASYPTTFGAIETDFANGTALKQVADGLYNTLNAWQSAQGQTFTSLATLAQNTLKAMVSIDGLGMTSAAPASLLTNISLLAAVQYLVNQMTVNGTTFNASVPGLGSQTAVGTPTGNAIVVGSVKNPQGNALQYVYPETLTLACTADSQSGGATAGNEPVSVTGQPQVADVFSGLWPGGSGVATSLSAVDGSKSNSTGNVLQNSDFFTATTANNPDNWTLQIGAAGTDVFTDTGNAYTTGGGALKFTGTGGGLLDAVTQSFNTTPAVTVGGGGTSYALKPDTVYILNCWVKCSATPAAGVLEFALVDGTAGIGTIFNDDAAVANSFTKSLTAVSTSFVNVNGAFRTPAVMPATTPYRLRVRLSTAIDSGKSVFVGRLSLNPATQIYAGGPFLSVFSGNTRMIAGLVPDTWTMAVTNTMGTFQQYFQKCFNMTALGLQFPNTASSPTVADSLVA